MIEFPRESQNTIPSSSVKIVGIGGAGANMIDRVALDGLEGAELLALNTDVRTLTGSVAAEKVQLGRNLTKGLGTGGDPELGHQAVLEAEGEVRAALKGRKIVFICVGLGGGTGSGAAPIVARIAREEGAFVVMFATMPFHFEGRRRRDQAETALNELAVLSNALVTFDNGRMGELVLAKQGIHEAFAAADRMISESIKAVIRLVVRPGLINIGLDDLMSALRTTRSRCLFGSGLARGKDRAQKALRNAMSSPLLDQGALLKDAETVLVHLCGGEDLTLFEIELLMESLGKHVPESAHVLFGAAVDPGMGEQLSITLVSSLPEERLRQRPARVVPDERPRPFEKAESFEKPEPVAKPDPFEKPERRLEPSVGFAGDEESGAPPPATPEPEEPTRPRVRPPRDENFFDEGPSKVAVAAEAAEAALGASDGESAPEADKPAFEIDEPALDEELPELDEELPELDEEPPEIDEPVVIEEPEPEREPEAESGEDAGDEDLPFAEAESGGDEEAPASPAPKRLDDGDEDGPFVSELDLGGEDEDKKGGSQGELSFEGGPRGRFEGADPNVFEGEDLDVPAFLRKKRR